jgi:hypothetical protein
MKKIRELAQEYVKKLGTADIPSSYTNGVSFVFFFVILCCLYKSR